MRKKIAGVVAAVAASSVFTVAGISIAEAVPAGGSASSSAATLRALDDRLESQWRADDITGMTATQAALTQELASLHDPRGHTTLTPRTVTTLGRAEQRNTELGRQLALAAHGNTAVAPAPTDLASAIQALVAAILALVQSVLGSVSAPPPSS